MNSVILCTKLRLAIFLQYSVIFVILSAILLQWPHPFSTMLSYFCYNAHPFCYNAWSFYDFVSHSHPVMHFATVLNHFMTLSAILEVPSVILVQCLSILQNSLIVLKIPSAILSNDYRRLTGVEGGSRLDWEVLGGRAARARARGGTQLDRACSGS
jgi:hypothetical protein